LRIAVCISGQLRGFRQAYPTWTRLGLDHHDCFFAVHAWKKIGRNMPIKSDTAQRCFSGQFLRAYKDVVSRMGYDFICDQ
jgi:hypothetical protein